MRSRQEIRKKVAFPLKTASVTPLFGLSAFPARGGTFVQSPRHFDTASCCWMCCLLWALRGCVTSTQCPQQATHPATNARCIEIMGVDVMSVKSGISGDSIFFLKPEMFPQFGSSPLLVSISGAILGKAGAFYIPLTVGPGKKGTAPPCINQPVGKTCV